MKESLYKILFITTGVFALILLGFGGFYYWKASNTKAEYDNLRVQSQNEIARMSQIFRENETTWSRLAQEKDGQIAELQTRIPELSAIIQERDEQIQNLTVFTAELQAVNIRLRRENLHQTEVVGENNIIRHRVQFSQTEGDLIRVEGYTLSSPPEAELSISLTRPLNVTVTTTQRPDFSWRTYVNVDTDLITIGEINSSVSPLARPQEQNSWEDSIYVGIGGAVAVTGNSGMGMLELGADFGNFEIGINSGIVGYPNGIDLLVGGSFRLNPFGF